jgi:tRNA-modifying protein YgfZ
MQISPTINKATHFCALPHLGMLRVSGEKATKFLQGQLTCDVNQINQNHSSMGLHCNPQGRIISNFRILDDENNYDLITLRELLPIAVQALNKYALFSRIDPILDTSEAWMHIGIIGENAHIDLATLLPTLPTKLDDVHRYEEMVAICIDIHTPRWHVLGKRNIMQHFQEKLQVLIQSIAFSTWQTLDLQQKLFWIHPEISEKFTPHALDLQHTHAISFKKGCYTGQEVIARVHYRGTLKAALYHAQIKTTTIPPLNTAVYTKNNDNPVGYIIAAQKNAEQTVDILVSLQIAAAEENHVHCTGFPLTIISALQQH